MPGRRSTLLYFAGVLSPWARHNLLFSACVNVTIAASLLEVSTMSDRLKWLRGPGKRIRVFPERDLRSLRAENVVMDTFPVQRLRHLHQLGLASLVFPTAEHSRFSHVLGTAYWTAKFLESLRINHWAETENLTALAEASSLLGSDVSLDLIARLYALLHDISHIPFGHTLEDQFDYFPRHDIDLPRLTTCFDLLDEGVCQYFCVNGCA